MPDFSIDYQMLDQVQSRMRELADTADSGGAKGALKDLGSGSPKDHTDVLGFTDLASAMWSFSQRSSNRAKDAKEGLEKLAGIFESVSDNYFQVDAQMAESAGVMGSSMGLDQWKQDKAAWEGYDRDTRAWNDYLQEIGADDYFREHPDADIAEVCTGEDGQPGWCRTYLEADNPPDPPGDAPDRPRPDEKPPTDYTVETENGSTTVHLELDDDNNVLVERSTIRTGDQEYVSETRYDTPPRPVEGPDGKTFDARDYTMVTTGPDGSETTSKYVIEDDGSGTMTVTDSEGTTTYTRSGLKDEWKEKKD